MKTPSFRSSTSEERQLAGLWAVAAVSSVVLRPLWIVLAPFLRPCTFHTITGIPCPSCGTTRTALAILNVDLPTAFLTNPLAAFAGVFFIVGGFGALPWLLFRWPLPSCGLHWSRWWTAALLTVVAVNWAYLIVTL